MKIAVLSFKEVSNSYAAVLLQKGHQVTLPGGGALHGYAIRGYLECDGCLLLGDDEHLLEIAHHMEAAGKPIWRELAEIPDA